jgi:hypothetical protein
MRSGPRLCRSRYGFNRGPSHRLGDGLGMTHCGEGMLVYLLEMALAEAHDEINKTRRRWRSQHARPSLIIPPGDIHFAARVAAFTEVDNLKWLFVVWQRVGR